MIDHLNELRDRVAKMIEPLGYDDVTFYGIEYNHYREEWCITFYCTDNMAQRLDRTRYAGHGQGRLTFTLKRRRHNGWEIVPVDKLMTRAERELAVIRYLTWGLIEHEFVSDEARKYVDSIEDKIPSPIAAS